MKSVNLKRIGWAFVAICMAGQAQAFITVGQSIDCDYDNLLDAYLAADPFVRVTSEATFSDNFIISKPKWFTGGYDNCADAESGTLGPHKTKWRRFNDGTVVNINANQAGPSIVVLDGFEIFGGTNNINNQPGGISIAGNSDVIIFNSEIYNNQGELGGAIKITGSQASLTLNKVIVRENSASLNGGGIYCEDEAKVTILEESAIKSNTADNQGGGIYGQTACELVSKSGDTLPAIQAQYGILFNEAWQGGGVYLRSAATMALTGNNEHPASVVFNNSLIDDDEGGGGLYLTGLGTNLNAINARIELNVAKAYGAGLGVYYKASVNMYRSDEPCWDNDKCSVLANNFVIGEFGVGGAMDIYSSASVNLSQTKVFGNRANSAAVSNVEDDSILRLEGNLITDNKHWNDSTTTELFSMDGGANQDAQIDFFYNTLVNNEAVQIFSLFEAAQHTLNIHNSIINHQGLTFEEYGVNNNLNSIDCVFLSEQASLTGNIGVKLLTDPSFVDAANGDYQLKSDSDAIDLCDEALFSGANHNDLNGQARGFDDPNINNFLGPYDAGAYEFNNDLIFKNDFE
ncbi:MAG: hypothetical protein DWP95_04535 [Proteobacteria bacterium]|nr:MAG: hypothetical protein DWP95_04535 [Pseudomonadota bacterium]